MRYKRWRALPNVENITEAAYFYPDIEHRVPIHQSDRIFAVGSCFARNVEAYLRPYFSVPSHVRPEEFPADIQAMSDELTKNMTLWHRYNVFSIRQSFEWSLEPDRSLDTARLMGVGNDRFIDPYAGCRVGLSRSDAERVSRWMDEVFCLVRHCRIVIITLGLSEVWEDCETGQVMNCSPLTEMWRLYPNRFRHRLASFYETIEELEKIFQVLAIHCLQDFNIIVTVSPIPLAATFRNVDIAVANGASKAILRAAAEEWTSRHANVHYFPSYEIILNSHPSITWLDDYRHCSIESIQHVTQVFLTSFIEREVNESA